MLDTRLVGYWSDEDLYLGAMEAADIAFCPDGSGWTYWSRDGGGFSVLRFRWHTTDDRQLALELHEQMSGNRELESGNRELEGRRTRHHVTSKAACDTNIVVAYEIRAGQDLFGTPATLLEADRPISRGTIGNRFALKRDLADGEQNPADRTMTGQ